MLDQPRNKLLTHQIELEKLYNKNQLIPRITKEFLKEPEIIQHMEDNGIPKEFGIPLLVQMALHKRTTLPTMIGILRHHTGTLQECADMILKACEIDLLDWNPATKQLIVKFTISQDIQDELDMFQYPLPMVVEPTPVNTNRDIGYILGTGSIILKHNHHDEDICLDHINTMNKVKLVINNDTATMIKKQWRNLDKPKAGETKADFNKRKKAFDKYDKSCHAVIQKLNAHGNSFYLTHKYDKRGRVYAQGYHVNYQGASWNKAVIQLADEELIK